MRLVVLLAMIVATVGALGSPPAIADGSTTGCDPVYNPDTAVNEDPIPQSSVLDGTPLEDDSTTPPPLGFLDIRCWSFGATGQLLTGHIEVREALPAANELPASPDTTGYTFYWHFQSGNGPNDGAALMHQRQRAGLLAEGDRYAFRGPYPIGDNFYWSLDIEYRFTPGQGPNGSNWTWAFAWTYLDPAGGFRFTDLLPVDNPGMEVFLSNGRKNVNVRMPFRVNWRSEKSKGTGADIGGGTATNCAGPNRQGLTFHCHAANIAQDGQLVRSAWVSTWFNRTASLPPAVCAFTQPTTGLCAIGGIISQQDQAPNHVTILGDYGFISYVEKEDCPVFVSTPIAVSSAPYYLQVNPIAVNPFWRPCYFKVPFSRTYATTGHQFVA